MSEAHESQAQKTMCAFSFPRRGMWPTYLWPLSRFYLACNAPLTMPIYSIKWSNMWAISLKLLASLSSIIYSKCCFAGGSLGSCAYHVCHHCIATCQFLIYIYTTIFSMWIWSSGHTREEATCLVMMPWCILSRFKSKGKDQRRKWS